MVIIIYLLIAQRRNKSEPKDNSQEINNLRDSINSSFNTMSASFNSLSKDVTRDMTQTLTSVNQKVEAFNMQVKDLTKSQNDQVFIFNGWTFASDPSLTPFDHAIYDLQLINCKA